MKLESEGPALPAPQPRLVEACVRGDFERAKQLVTEGCPVNDGDSAGRRPLHFAAGSACHELTKILIDYKADVNCSASEGSTPLHLASGLHLIPKLRLSDEQFDNVHLGVEILLQAGANHRIQNRFGCTPLHTALYMASHTVAQQQLPFATVGPYVTKIIQILLRHGAEVNCQDNDGCTPLHYASDSGFVEVVSILIRAGANVNLTNKEGKTALHYAVSGGNLSVASILYHMGADPTIANNKNQTPLDCVEPDKKAEFELLFASPRQPSLIQDSAPQPADNPPQPLPISQPSQDPAPTTAPPPETVPVVAGGRSCCTIL